ncbi:hypothetical protein ACF3NS_15225 [Arsenicicoccus cauae]|uniref:hypothetical protein n=1 Tax=Arsenicicoccus cauae TaxID=2663847 RepID=UPI00370D6A16
MDWLRDFLSALCGSFVSAWGWLVGHDADWWSALATGLAVVVASLALIEARSAATAAWETFKAQQTEREREQASHVHVVISRLEVLSSDDGQRPLAPGEKTRYMVCLDNRSDDPVYHAVLDSWPFGGFNFEGDGHRASCKPTRVPAKTELALLPSRHVQGRDPQPHPPISVIFNDAVGRTWVRWSTGRLESKDKHKYLAQPE